MKVWFHPAADVEQLDVEHLDHVAYYESRQIGLGAGYLAEFEKVLAAVAAGPHRFARVGATQLRLGHLRRFPITVIFRESGGELQVLAVAHKRRRPGYWATRL